MKFYFDESGNFQLPTNPREHRVGIVAGIVIAEAEEAEVFKQFDAFVASLPPQAFRAGEPKGRLLGDVGRRGFAEFIADLPGTILVCPTMLDLTTLVGRLEADVVSLVISKVAYWQSLCVHETMRSQLADLAAQVARMSPQQLLRLCGWARCIGRAIQDSIIYHSGAQYHPAWSSVRFEIDPVEEHPGGREETVFRTLLPAWVTGWSQNEPVTTIQELHTADHPFMRNWDRPEGIDIGRLFRRNVQYPSSANSKGIQMADMIASVVRRAVMGGANAVNLQDYGLIMTRTIGQPLRASGLFSLAPADPMNLKRRYAGIPQAIHAARTSCRRAYCSR